MRRRAMRRVFLSLCAILLAAVTARAEGPWQPVGLGGSGGMFAMAVSPLDPRLMIVNCDMSGAYITRDAGRTWQMIIHHKMLPSNTRCSPVFHPTNASRIYAAGGDNVLRTSDDAGATWRPLVKGRGPWKGGIRLLYVAPDYPKSLLVGTAEEAFVTLDGGATWHRCEGVKGAVVGVVAGRADPSAAPGQKYHFIATSEGIFRSPDFYKGYAPCGKGLPQGAITSFSGGSKGQTRRLYATVECSLAGGRLTGGVYVSEDAGAT